MTFTLISVFHISNKACLLLAGLLLGSALAAQPANDHCANASVINISNGGYGLGVFNGTTFDISAATIQSGETFAPAISSAGQTKKSMWYKFTLPTTRKLEVFIKQPSALISNGDVGFAVYKASTCLPANAQISTQLTPIALFSSTKFDCTDPGEYYVQVSAKDNANGPVFILLEIQEPDPAPYDKPAAASKFGKVINLTTAVLFKVGCQSIDDASEKCNSSVNQTKSTWHTFTTPDYFDWLAVLTAAISGNSDPANRVIGYRLYQGDVSVTPVASLIPVTGCDSMKAYTGPFDYKTYKCGELNTNTPYTVQLLYSESFNGDVRFAVSWQGTGAARAPQPLNTIPAVNKLGVLPGSFGAGTTTSAAPDRFACNSRHALYSCPKALPVPGIFQNLGSDQFGVPQNFYYNLSNFYSFTIGGTADVRINAGTDAYGAFPPFLRLFKQGLVANCPDLDTANIVASGFTNLNFTCISPGDYVLQVMGVDTNIASSFLNMSYDQSYLQTGYGGNIGLSLRRHLGTNLSVSINVINQFAANKYSLSAPGKYYATNANTSGVMQPLASHQLYNLPPDTMGCSNTVLPDLTCFNNLPKAAYYEFAANDSGSLYYTSWSEVPTRIYKGDANALVSAQNKFAYPEKFTGLIPQSSCIGGPHFIFQAHEKSDQICITPGTFTLVGISDLKDKYGDQGSTQNLTITFKNTRPKFADPLQAENLGDLWSKTGPGGGVVQSVADTFTCHDNPAIIDGFVPCTGDYNTIATKQAYREFYLSKTSLITIEATIRSALFAGRASDGLSTLKHYKDFGSCGTLFDNNCVNMPAGWYTIVSYGWGAGFANPTWPNPWENFIATPHSVKFTLRVQPCPLPKYNRPNKAAIDTLTGQPFLIQWGPRVGSTSAYPRTDTTYYLYTESFLCPDTPFAAHPVIPCITDPGFIRVAYYVFQVTQVSFLRINTSDPSLMTRASLYAGNVRTTPNLLVNTSPIQPCIESTVGQLMLCNVQPGYYTLVVYAHNNMNCRSITPSIYIDKMGYSRFDHANNAYDFGLIPSDSVWYNGKPGDVNPLDPGRAPSNDFFYCTTGSQPDDPAYGCGSLYLSTIYNSGINNPLFPVNLYYNWPWSIPHTPRRNLWYTFTVDKGGWVKVRVNNKTPGKADQYPFLVMKSDVNGTLPFSLVVSSGAVDSTAAQGLIGVAGNAGSGQTCTGGPEVAFFRAACSPVTERYYVIVQNFMSESMIPNHQAEVSVLFDSVSAILPKYDHYSQANTIGTNLGPGTYNGNKVNISCATGDVTDPLSGGVWPPSCDRTIWYKFSTTITGTIKMRMYKDPEGYWETGSPRIQLFREIIPGDSTSTGLQYIGANPVNYGGGIYYDETCINPGTYYIILPNCNHTAGEVYPQFVLEESLGDFCSRPLSLNVNGAGIKTVSAVINCHTIGTDYGEFNPALTCPDGKPTRDYKTTWYRLDITGTDSLDVTVYINERTNASGADVKYRMMTGNCGAMQEGSCVQNAGTRNTYRCLAPGNSYFIQVFTPVLSGSNMVTGEVDLVVEAVKKTEVCLPAPNCIAVAGFTTQFDCANDREVTFINSSTYGTDIQYQWDFGFNNQKSNATVPKFFYPALSTNATYTVRLIVSNIACGKKDTSFQTITILARPGVNLGRDTTLCAHESNLVLNAFSHSGTTYLWNNGATTQTRTINTTGTTTAWVELTFNNCKARDTVNIWINPIAKSPLKVLALCSGVPSVNLNAARNSGENYTWNDGTTSAGILATQPGYYWCDLYLNGCIVRDSFLVISPSINQGQRTINVCQKDIPYAADATISGASAYKWSDNNTNARRNLTTPGTYWVDITISGCTVRDSIVLAVDSFKTANVTARICGGQVYTLPSGKKVNTTALYRDTLRNMRGCDSLITDVALTVDTVKKVASTVSICAGQSYSLPSNKVINMAGLYLDTVRYKASGCDSLISTINLTVAVVNRETKDATICTGKAYLLAGGKSVSIAGQYLDTLKAKAGCDSLIITTNLTVLTPITNTASASVCFGNTYTLPGGRIVSISGLYRDTIRYVNGCDSLISNISVSVGDAIMVSKKAYVCEGYSYTLPSGRQVSTTGIYRDTVRSVQGCDSLISSIDLTLQTLKRNNRQAFICAGQQYSLPSGRVVTMTGIYNDTLRYNTGCDSVISTVDLSVYDKITNTASVSVCFGETYTLPSGRVVNASGLYRDTIRYVNGCDSLISNITVSVGDAIMESKKAYVCEGYSYTLPSGRQVSTTGIYRDTVRSVQGCDSLISSIDLTLQTLIRNKSQAFICAGQQYSLPSGRKVAATGVYQDTLHYTTGCDSVVNTIDLKVYPTTNTTNNVSVCFGKTYTLPGGRIISTSGFYRDTLRYANGCDSLITNITLAVGDALRESSAATICLGQSYTLPSGRSISTAGSYSDTLRTVAGCDSLITTVMLTVDAPQIRTLSLAICYNGRYNSPSGKVWTTGGTYADTLRNIRGCDSLHYSINLRVIPVLTQSRDVTICSGQSHTLPGGRTVMAAGIYTDTLKAQAGCDSIVTTMLQVNPPLVVSLQSRMAICLGDTAAITATATGGNGGPYSYTWTGTTGSGNKVTVTPASTTTYSVSVTDGCTVQAGVASVNIQTIGPPQPGLNNATKTICLGAGTTLQATGGAAYEWSPATGLSRADIPNPQASPAADTRYRVRVTTAQGCVGEDSVLVRVTQPFTLTASRDTVVCTGGSTRLTASGAQRYQWSGGGISNTTATVTVRPGSTTTYTVTGYGIDQCFEQTKTIVVTVIPLPQVNAGNDTTVMVGSSFALQPLYGADVNQYRWTPSQWLSCTSCPNPVTMPREPVTYTITVRNQYQCEASDTRRIDLLCSNESVFVPNTFTPNGDGVNDVWYPRGNGIQSVRFLRVFNRWGQIVFERLNFNADDRSAGWDGSFKGQLLPPDVYVYSMGVVCDNNQTVEVKGNVMIVR